MTWTQGHALPGNRWDLLDGMTADAAPSVSVIVAHYRQPEQLARTLEALRRQDHPADRLEIIVADDGSPEVPTLPTGVRLVRQDDEGFRLAAIRNRGVAVAGGDILVFLDADTTPEPAFIRELVRLPSLAPDAVTVGRRRHADLDGVGPSIPILDAVEGRELTEPAWLQQAYAASRDLLDADDRSYRHVIGAVIACSRRMFDEVGGFDESFTSYGGEDWEWAYRAWIRGAVLAHVSTAVAWHDGPDAGARSGTSGSERAAITAQTLRLADLIPVPGSRPRGLRSAKVDIAVLPPPRASPAQAFVSLDSVVAAIPGSEPLVVTDAHPTGGDPTGGDRFDRVRVRVEILRPVRADGDALTALAAVVARIGTAVADGIPLGEVTVLGDQGAELIRVVSTRARARSERWGRADLFTTERTVVDGVRELVGEPNVEAYLGGWG